MASAATAPTTSFPDSLHEEMLTRASKVITFLNNLTEEIPLPGNRIKTAAMPITAFRGAKALVFVFRRKYAFLGSYQHELGFITSKLTAADGTVTWSPPLWLQSRSLGFGISIGYFRAGFCTAALDDAALAYCLKSRTLANVRATFLIDMNGARVRAVQMDSSTVDDTVSSDATAGTRANYFRADAMLVDFSVNLGRISLWNSSNAASYGKASPEDILSGKVPCPTEFLSVLDVLKRHAAASSKHGSGLNKQRSGLSVRDFSGRGGGLAATASLGAIEIAPPVGGMGSTKMSLQILSTSV